MYETTYTPFCVFWMFSGNFCILGTVNNTYSIMSHLTTCFFIENLSNQGDFWLGNQRWMLWTNLLFEKKTSCWCCKGKPFSFWLSEVTSKSDQVPFVLRVFCLGCRTGSSRSCCHQRCWQSPQGLSMSQFLLQGDMSRLMSTNVSFYNMHSKTNSHRNIDSMHISWISGADQEEFQTGCVFDTWKGEF